MRIEAPRLCRVNDGDSEYSDDIDEFLAELSHRETHLRRQMQSWLSTRELEAAQTDQIVAQLSADLKKQRQLVADSQLSITTLTGELSTSKEEIVSLRGKLRFLEARYNGLQADLKARRTLAAANEARLKEEISDLRRELKILRSVRQTA